MRKVSLIIRRITSCLLGFAPLLLIAAGIRVFIMAVQARDPATYSIRYHYIGDALLLSSVGLIGLFGCHRLWRAGSCRTWALVPIVAAFFAVLFPVFQYGHHGSPLERSYRSTALELGSVAHQLTQAAKENGRFTCVSFSDPLNPQSMFLQQGQALPYVVQCVANATCPVTGAAPERPGTAWFDALNAPAAAKVTAAIFQLSVANWSGVKGVGRGVLERKIEFGPGYRVYFGKDD